MLGTAYCLRRGIYQIFLRELQSLPADSNDIPVRIPAQVDIAVLFFLGGQAYCMAGHSAEILFTL
jgi:hypothetical protein